MGGGDSLYDKIDRGMRGCKAVVSCITQKYSLSANCRREISLADALKKPIIPLMLEQMKWPPDGPMSMVFTELLYINFFSDEKVQMVWKGEKANELIEKLKQFIPEITLTNENKGKGTNKTSSQSKTNVRNEQPTEKKADDTKTDMTVSKTNGNQAAVSTNKGKPTRNVAASNSLSKNNQPSNNAEQVPTPKTSGRGNEKQTNDIKSNLSNGMNIAKPIAQIAATENRSIKVSEEKGEPTSTRGNRHYKGNIHVEKDVTLDQSIAKTNAKSPDAVTNETKKTNKQDPKAHNVPNSRTTDVTETSVETNSQQQRERSMKQPSSNTEQVASPKLSSRGNDKRTTDLKNDASNGINKAKPTAQNTTTENRGAIVSEENGEPTLEGGNRHNKGNIHVKKDVLPDQSIAKPNGKSTDTVLKTTKKTNKDDPKVHHGPNSRNTDGTETSVGTKKHQKTERPKNSADITAGPKTEIKQQGPDKSKSPPKKVVAATNKNAANNQNKVRNEKQLETESNKPKSTSCAIL